MCIRDRIFTVPSQMNRFIHEFSKMHSSDSTVGKMLASIVEDCLLYTSLSKRILSGWALIGRIIFILHPIILIRCMSAL